MRLCSNGSLDRSRTRLGSIRVIGGAIGTHDFAAVRMPFRTCSLDSHFCTSCIGIYEAHASFNGKHQAESICYSRLPWSGLFGYMHVHLSACRDLTSQPYCKLTLGLPQRSVVSCRVFCKRSGNGAPNMEITTERYVTTLG